MKYTSDILSILIPIFLSWLLFYLIGAFVSASWNVSEWTPQARIVCAIWSSVFAYALWYRLENVK
jgi:membrane protein implicated in regulation of membrane protease activity